MIVPTRTVVNRNYIVHETTALMQRSQSQTADV